MLIFPAAFRDFVRSERYLLRARLVSRPPHTPEMWGGGIRQNNTQEDLVQQYIQERVKTKMGANAVVSSSRVTAAVYLIPGTAYKVCTQVWTPIHSEQ